MEIDIEDYLDEASTHSIVNELKSRKGWENALSIPKDRRPKIEQIKDILELRPFATKDDIIKEIQEL